jgi:ferritin-like metal-binding protein YciE
MNMESEVRELLAEEIKDAYSAEKQALRCMCAFRSIVISDSGGS